MAISLPRICFPAASLALAMAAQGISLPATAFPKEFLNLAFEYPSNVPAEPSPPPWGWDLMTPSDAFPSWMISYGGSGPEILQYAAHNTWYDWTPSVVLFDLNSAYVIDGGYSLGLKAGFDLLGNAQSASISQTGLIPQGTHSLQLKAAAGSSAIHVSIGGQEILLLPLLTTEQYVLYGGDVERFAETTTELKFLIKGGERRAVLDSIVFSPEPVPEPSTLVFLLILAGCLMMRKLTRSSNRTA